MENYSDCNGCIWINIHSKIMACQEFLTLTTFMKFYTQNRFQRLFVEFDYLVTALPRKSAVVRSDKLSSTFSCSSINSTNHHDFIINFKLVMTIILNTPRYKSTE